MLISLLLFKSNLYQTRPENKSLLQKIAKILSAGGFAPRLPVASGGWTLPPYPKAQPSPQTPSGFRQLDSAPIPESTALTPDSQWLPAAGLCPHTRKHIPPIANFWLCSWLVVSTRIANALRQNFWSMTSTKK